MSGNKTEFNNQWGNVAPDGGELDPPTQQPPEFENRGIAPLVDPYGRPWVRIVGGGGVSAIPIPGATGAATSLIPFQFGGALVVPVLQVATGAGKFYQATGYNGTGMARWLMVFSGSAAPPANGDVPMFCLRLENNRSGTIDMLQLGVRYEESLGVAISTTSPLLTLPGVNEYVLDGVYFNL